MRLSVPASVEKLGFMAFQKCEALAEVSIPETCRLETIEDSCFTSTALREFEVPASVKTVGMDAFALCPFLKILYAPDAMLPGTRAYLNLSVQVGPPKR